ncbi:MAG: hypothetical protein ABIJ18_00540 [archaeon]
MKRGLWLVVAMLMIPSVTAVNSIGDALFGTNISEEFLLRALYFAIVFVVFFTLTQKQVFKEPSEKRYAMIFALAISLIIMRFTPAGMLNAFRGLLILFGPFVIFYTVGKFFIKSADEETFSWGRMIFAVVMTGLLYLVLAGLPGFSYSIGGVPFIGLALDELFADIYYGLFYGLSPLLFMVLVGVAIFGIVSLFGWIWKGKNADGTSASWDWKKTFIGLGILLLIIIGFSLFSGGIGGLGWLTGILGGLGGTLLSIARWVGWIVLGLLVLYMLFKFKAWKIYKAYKAIKIFPWLWGKGKGWAGRGELKVKVKPKNGASIPDGRRTDFEVFVKRRLLRNVENADLRVRLMNGVGFFNSPTPSNVVSGVTNKNGRFKFSYSAPNGKNKLIFRLDIVHSELGNYSGTYEYDIAVDLVKPLVVVEAIPNDLNVEEETKINFGGVFDDSTGTRFPIPNGTKVNFEITHEDGSVVKSLTKSLSKGQADFTFKPLKAGKYDVDASVDASEFTLSEDTGCSFNVNAIIDELDISQVVDTEVGVGDFARFRFEVRNKRTRQFMDDVNIVLDMSRLGLKNLEGITKKGVVGFRRKIEGPTIRPGEEFEIAVSFEDINSLYPRFIPLSGILKLKIKDLPPVEDLNVNVDYDDEVEFNDFAEFTFTVKNNSGVLLNGAKVGVDLSKFNLGYIKGFTNGKGVAIVSKRITKGSPGEMDIIGFSVMHKDSYGREKVWSDVGSLKIKDVPPKKMNISPTYPTIINQGDKFDFKMKVVDSVSKAPLEGINVSFDIASLGIVQTDKTNRKGEVLLNKIFIDNSAATGNHRISIVVVDPKGEYGIESIGDTIRVAAKGQKDMDIVLNIPRNGDVEGGDTLNINGTVKDKITSNPVSNIKITANLGAINLGVQSFGVTPGGIFGFDLRINGGVAPGMKVLKFDFEDTSGVYKTVSKTVNLRVKKKDNLVFFDIKELNRLKNKAKKDKISLQKRNYDFLVRKIILTYKLGDIFSGFREYINMFHTVESIFGQRDFDFKSMIEAKITEASAKYAKVDTKIRIKTMDLFTVNSLDARKSLDDQPNFKQLKDPLGQVNTFKNQVIEFYDAVYDVFDSLISELEHK